MKIKLWLPLLLAGIFVTGCTDRFDSLNSDPTKYTSPNPSVVPNAFAYAQYQGIYGDAGLYQLAVGLYPNLYAQYYANSATYFRSDRYTLVQDWIISQWSSVYTTTIPSLNTVMDFYKDSNPAAYAMAQIWRVLVFQMNTDFYGPIPYSQASKGDLVIPYDSQRDVYYDFFTQLDEAVATLEDSDPTETPFGSNDLIYHGDIPRWIKFANTLRLRMAMRISYVEPDKARTEAEKAVAAGVMTSNDDNGMMDVSANSSNGLNASSSWNEFRMSATMESVLKGYDDPRMEVYFSPAESDGEYHGLRNGYSAEELGDPKNANTALSNVGAQFGSDYQNTNPLPVMYASEAYFLRAEGALNGWDMGGTAKDLYEAGITLSFEQWGIGDASTYIAGETGPIDLDDFLGSQATTDIPVKFESDPERQREQILTQKWLAIYPNGIEAWAETRRTGYPKLYPVVNSENSDVPVGEVVRRFPYLDYEKQTNADGVATAMDMLSGPDKASTRLWWNVE